jgi:mono/diheme cytochrome c family protein
MRNKFLLVAALSVIIIAVQVSSCNSSDTKSAENATEDSLKQVVARGEYLANHVAGCMDCHSQRDFTKFSGPVVPGSEGGGGFVFDEKLGLPGVIYGKNISPDKETGIGNWTDEEVLKAMTQGINKTNDTLFPLMPYPHFNRIAKEDLMSIIAYIRSLKPVRNAIPARKLFMPIAMAYPAGMLQPNVDANKRPPETDLVKYGEYLVTLADCGTCHSPLTQQGPDMTRKFSGGYVFRLDSFTVVSANITPDSATGIGTWTEKAFIDKFRNNASDANVNRNPGRENTIMPWALFGKMKTEDLKAIYAYLRTVPAMSNKIEKWPAK